MEMLIYAVALVLGIGVGLVGALPGLHPAVLLVGLLPVLAIKGDFGAVLIAGALGSSMVAATLAKTFHPASPETLRSATPEQVMAYRGDGFKAVHHQLHGAWIGLAVAIAIAIPLLLLASIQTGGLRPSYDALVKPVAPWVIAAYTVAVFVTAQRKLPTALTMLGAGLLGFVAFNHTNSGSDILGPLLGGAFGAAPVLMVIWHRGKLNTFPTQRVARVHTLSPESVAGAALGVGTAMCAGIGASAATSIFAGHVKEHVYLAMQAASESANNAFAIALLILVGATRSGAAVAVQQGGAPADTVLGLLLLLGVLGGVIAGSFAVLRLMPAYVSTVAGFSPRVTASLVLMVTVALSVWHSGPFGACVMVAATLLGLAAKLSFAPNQALVTVLTTPVLIYYLGGSATLSGVLGILR